MKKSGLFTLVLLLFIFSCKKEAIMNGEVTNNPTFAAELSASPDTIAVGPYHLFLKAIVGRDFMPGGGENSSAMVSLNWLTDIDSTAISNTVVLNRQYIVMGDKIWSTNYTEIDRSKAHIIQGIARKGPLWETGIYVDVICEFETNGEIFRVISKSQRIEATF
ncbi:MAG: hypothetical protein ACI8ZM_001783 [Crocinitomix sp.]|jgi:hypothetical protein